MPRVVDYSFSRPDPAAIAAAGYVGAVRYLAGGRGGKELTRPELERLHGAGLEVGLVWETTASRAGEGEAAGRLDVGRAEAQADSLGWPSSRPIYYAVDFDATPAAVAGYFAGVAGGARRPWGVYGSYRIVEALADRTPWLWQCAAWSGSGAGTGGSIQGRRLSSSAVMFQRVGYVLGNTCDENDVLRPDWGGWHPDHAPTTSTSEEDDMASVLVLNPDVTDHEEWWEIVGLERRLMNTVFGTAELDVLTYLGAKKLGADVDDDARRFWLNARVPVVVGPVDPKVIAEQVVAAVGAGAAQAVVDELGRRIVGHAAG